MDLNNQEHTKFKDSIMQYLFDNKDRAFTLEQLVYELYTEKTCKYLYLENIQRHKLLRDNKEKIIRAIKYILSDNRNTLVYLVMQQKDKLYAIVSYTNLGRDYIYSKLRKNMFDYEYNDVYDQRDVYDYINTSYQDFDIYTFEILLPFQLKNINLNLVQWTLLYQRYDLIIKLYKLYPTIMIEDYDKYIQWLDDINDADLKHIFDKQNEYNLCLTNKYQIAIVQSTLTEINNNFIEFLKKYKTLEKQFHKLYNQAQVTTVNSQSVNDIIYKTSLAVFVAVIFTCLLFIKIGR